MQQPRRGHFRRNKWKYLAGLGAAGAAGLALRGRGFFKGVKAAAKAPAKPPAQAAKPPAQAAKPPTPAPVTPREPVKRIYNVGSRGGSRAVFNNTGFGVRRHAAAKYGVDGHPFQPGKMSKTPHNYKKERAHRYAPSYRVKMPGGRRVEVERKGNWQQRLKDLAAEARKKGERIRVRPITS